MPLTDVRLLPNEQTGITFDSRGGIYDLASTDAEGNFYLVEMQVGHYPEFLQRMKFYALYRLNTLIQKGNYRFEQLPRVFCIGVLGTTLFPAIGAYHNLAVLRNEEGVAMDQQLTFVTVELPEFDKPAADCHSDLDKLLFTMQNAHKITDAAQYPVFWEESWIKKAMEEIDTRRMSPEQRLQYEMQLSANALAVKHARLKEEQAKDEGREEGVEIGREEGVEIGREEERLKSIRLVLGEGRFTLAEIARLFQVPLATVEALQRG